MTARVASLTCLLGLTWITGFLLYTESEAVAYIFTIINGLQGVFIFTDRCLLNTKIRNGSIDGIKSFKSYVVGYKVIEQNIKMPLVKLFICDYYEI